MNKSLEVKIVESQKSYQINITDEPIEALYKELLLKTQHQKRLIVFSEKVFKLYSKNLPFPKQEILVLKDGETQKNLKNYLKIVNKLIKNNMSRNDVIICVGGGVIGDMAGFVSATYMRGIQFIQVPTTLLSMVDSSVGGKTAVDLPEGKNIIGAFYQPKEVFINLNFLRSLDETQYMSGLGEVLKYAFIEKDCCKNDIKQFYEFLVTNVSKVKNRDFVVLEQLITTCLEFKINVVTLDEKEAGLRKVLNLGHTFGHALESFTKYKKYTHGQAVAWGIYVIFDWALKNGCVDLVYYSYAIKLLELYGFQRFNKKINFDRIIELMKMDKKSNNGQIKLIVPSCDRQVVEQEITNISDFKNFLQLSTQV